MGLLPGYGRNFRWFFETVAVQPVSDAPVGTATANPPPRPVMRLLTWNSLIMFDIVFIFFLFLIGVTCLVYYLPGRRVDQDESSVYMPSRPLQCYVTVPSGDVQRAPVDHV
ncbi:hypothetical protein GWI33_003471 [Rhynchophorus ferrugineus]|uniref:Uncharacterized protein n=1 Tax=Rhynchophorus ferrugineus TaxID=354439 RepID=A0A834MFV2_RHYFE|nr:hypothetical protein GWI33_003471 [Rhynchophorus ferrugineus]